MNDPLTESSTGWPPRAQEAIRILHRRIRMLTEENDLLKVTMALMGESGAGMPLATVGQHPNEPDWERAELSIPLPQLRRWSFERPSQGIIETIDDRNNIPTLVIRLCRQKKEA